MRSATPRSSPSGYCEKADGSKPAWLVASGWWPVAGSCEKRTVPSQQRPAFRYDATPPGQRSPYQSGRLCLESFTPRDIGCGRLPLRVRYQRKCRLGSAKLVRLPRADPLDATSAVADSTLYVRMRQRSASSQGAELCHVRGRELEFVRMRQWSASSQVRRSVFPKRRCIVRAKASGAIPCRAATDRA
jgi:hypothetical protein